MNPAGSKQQSAERSYGRPKVLEENMDIGIGLPTTLPGTKGELIMEWARRADSGTFSSVGTIDRLAYGNYESLITLAAVSAVTRRVRLATTILIAPLRNPGVLAKQAATLDALSGGRLILGMGIGSREDDFRVAPATYRGRGRRFEEQLALMKHIWAGQPPEEGLPPVGPTPVQLGGPLILIGGNQPNALRRAGRLADGFISGGGGNPERARESYGLVEEAWRKAERKGKPRLVCAVYYALGPRAAERGSVNVLDYYRFMGPNARMIAQSFPSSEGAVKSLVQGFEGIGADELIFWPTIPDLDQVDRLREAVG
jgi:alkanesulfonate monooxygenase SsuD/methylene tetrahydromethanopterin reductase-like flavin-dependent oxidoreductase (luciferase family)